MQGTSFEIILYVKDQAAGCAFYKYVLNKEPVLNVPGMTEFDLGGNLKLGLMPESGIAKILKNHTPDPADGNGIPRCELYILDANAEEYFERSRRAGAKLISEFGDRDWGHCVAYVADPDGHILAFARKVAD